MSSSVFHGVPFIILVFTTAGYTACAHQTKIDLYNACPFPVWPAWLSNAGLPYIGPGGVYLGLHDSYCMYLPWGWSGRFWARTGCCKTSNVFNISKAVNTREFKRTNSYENLICETGDCRGELGCQTPGLPPATLVEFTPVGNPKTLLDYYDVSLVDGYNIPIRVIPSDPTCKQAGCHGDLNPSCPEELAVRTKNGVVACKSPCIEFKTDRFCCTGVYNTASMCKESVYSRCFKKFCSFAYSYPFDSVSSGFSCQSGASYTIVFCPSGSNY